MVGSTMFLCMGFPSPLLIFPVMLAPIPQEQGQKLSPFLNLNVKEKKKKEGNTRRVLKVFCCYHIFYFLYKNMNMNVKRTFSLIVHIYNEMKSEIRCRVIRNRGECFLAYRLRRGHRRIVKCLVIGWQLIRFISRKFFFLRVTVFYSYKWRDW